MAPSFAKGKEFAPQTDVEDFTRCRPSLLASDRPIMLRLHPESGQVGTGWKGLTVPGARAWIIMLSRTSSICEAVLQASVLVNSDMVLQIGEWSVMYPQKSLSV